MKFESKYSIGDLVQFVVSASEGSVFGVIRVVMFAKVNAEGTSATYVIDKVNLPDQAVSGVTEERIERVYHAV